MGEYVKKPLQTSGGNPNQGAQGFTEDFRDRTPALIDADGKINLDREFLSGRSEMEQQMTSMGFDVGRLDLQEYDYANLYRDWNSVDAREVPDFYDPFEAESYEFERWAITDMAAGLWNRGVAGMVSGLAQAPAIVGAAITGGEVDGFWDSWIQGANDMGEAMSVQQSDRSLIPMTSEINSSNLAYAIGDGLGFVADIFLGSHGVGSLVKAGSAVSKVQRAQRLGSFLTGTVQMQKDLYQEGIRNGLNPGDAARVAIPTASIVSLSEGAALEMLGATISGQTLRGIGTSALKGEFQAMGKAFAKGGSGLTMSNFKKLAPKYAKSFGQKMKSLGASAYKGATVEATQEFTQQYIEDFGKFAYDTWFAGDDKTKGKGKFGVEWDKTLEKAMVGALVGGLVGGMVSGGGSAIRGVEGNTTFAYVKDAIDNNKPGKIKRIINQVNRMGANGKVENAPEVIQAIKDMTRFSQSIKGLNIDSSTANFQLFQLNQIQQQFQEKFGKEFKTDPKTNYLIANAYRINEQKATMLTQAMNNEMQVLIQDKKPLTKDLNKFETKLNNYQKLFKQIQKGQINEEQLVKEIRKNESPTVTKWRQSIEAEMEKIKQSQLDNDGVSVNEQLDNLDAEKLKKKESTLEYVELPNNKKATKKAITDFEKIIAERDKMNTAAEKDSTVRDAFADKMRDEYGMTLADLTELETNWTFGENIKSKREEGSLKYVQPKTKQTEESKTPKQENRIKELEQEIEDQKRVVAITGPAKAGDVTSTDANLKLKQLEKSLEIEKAAVAASERKEGTTPVFENEEIDGKFYRDNQKEIESRAKEIRENKEANKIADAIKKSSKEELEDAAKKAEEIKEAKKKPESKKKEDKKVAPKKVKEDSKAERIAKRDKKLFEETQEAPGIPGKPKLDNIINDGNVTTGVYVNENGDIDIVISSTGTNQNYVGFYRVYEDGKPTNKFTSKMQVVDGKGFGKMIANAQKQLPEGHQWLETKSVSKDGLRVWNKAKQKGYKEVVDENGNIVTNEVTLNQATKEGITGESTDYKDVVVSKAEADNIVNELQEIYPGIETSTIKGGPGKVKIKIKLPVLESTTEKVDSTKTEDKVPTETKEVSTEISSSEEIKQESAAILNEYSNSEIAKIIRREDDEYSQNEESLGRFIERKTENVEGGKAIEDIYEYGIIQRIIANDGSKIQRLVDLNGKVHGIPLINLTMDAKESGLLFDGKKDFSLSEKEISDFFKSKFGTKKDEAEFTDEGIDEDDMPFGYTPMSEEDKAKLDNQTKDKKEQRTDLKRDLQKEKLEANKIKNNPELYAKILNHFQKLFPNIPVQQLNNALWKNGPFTVAYINELGVTINTDEAFQNTLLHEGAHIIKEILGDNHPLIKAGMQFIKGTDYFKNAQILYSDKSVAEQAEEALMEAIADNSLEKLKTKLEGTNLQKFVSWLKRFWNAAKRAIGLKKGKQSVEMLADMLAYEKAPYNADLGLFNEFKEQRSALHMQTVQEVQSTISLARLNYRLNPEDYLNPTTKQNLKYLVYNKLGLKVIQDSIIANPNSINETLSSQTVNQIKEETDKELRAQKLYYALKVENNQLWKLIETTTNQLSKKSLPTITDLEELVKTELKGNKDISESVRSIVTAIVDNDGYLYDSNEVYQNIARIADKSIDIKSFEKNLQEDETKGNDIAKKINLILNAFPTNAKNGILSELASLTTIEYRSLIKTHNVVDGQKVTQVLWKRVNKDRTVDDLFNRYAVNYKNANLNQLRLLNSQLKDIKKGFAIKRFVVDQDVNNAFFQNAKMFVEELVGDSFTNEEFKQFLNKQIKTAPSVEKKVQRLSYLFAASSKRDGTFTPGSFSKLLNDIKTQNKFDKKEFSGVLRNLAIAKKGDSISSNFVNQAGNNVTATKLGYWVNQFGKMFAYDNKFRNELLNSTLYKANPVLKEWAKSKEIPEWFIHDAFENTGFSGAIEHNNATINDIVLNNFFYYSQNKSNQKSYAQSIGVTGDRGHLTYFKVPKYSEEQLINEYKIRAKLDEALLNRKIRDKGVSPKSLVNQFNKLSLNQAVIFDGKVEVFIDAVGDYEMSLPRVRKRVENLYKLLENSGTLEALAQQNPSVIVDGKINKDKVNELITNYIYTESLNRSYLTDIYAGPAIDRKSVADVMKRMAGLNSGGKLIQIDKPVHVFVLDTSGADGKIMSDSFSFNGSHLANHISEQSGSTDVVGVNMKDMLYQISNDGGLDFYKMSTLNVTGEIDDNSLTQFTDSNNLTEGYNAIGNAILELEKALGDNAYVKIIDKDVVKGDLSQYDKIPINEFLADPAKVKNRNTLKEFKNYRVAFNLNKDLSKVPLANQNVIMSTQLAKILLNHDVSIEEIENFENALVSVLDDSLKENQTFSKLNNINRLLNELTKDSEENTKSEIIEILSEMKRLNSGTFETTYRIGNYNYSQSQVANLGSINESAKKYADNLITKQEWQDILNKHEMSEEMFNEAMTNNVINRYKGKDLGEFATTIKKSKKVSVLLDSFDHPNLKPMVEQFISSRLTKQGIRTNMSGMYAHMLPDFTDKLKGYKENGLEPMEIGVPWSLFIQKRPGESDESAKGRAEELLKEKPELFRNVVVRVPASGAVSSFAGQVKFFVDGHSNTAIVPKSYMEAADADNDGDKVFVYRADLNKESELLESNKTKAFNQVYEKANSKAQKEAAVKGDLSLDRIKELLKEFDLYNEDVFQLNSNEDFAKLANNMSFGADAIGIWAVASKMLSMLSQSQEQLKKPISFGFENGNLVDIKRQKFTNNALSDVAVFLQAALDMGNDPVHISTGVNEYTIGVATALSLMDVSFEEIIPFLNSKPIADLVNEIDNAKTNYIDKSSFSINKFLKAKLNEFDAKKGSKSKAEIKAIIENGGQVIQKDQVVPGIFKTGDTYYKVEEIEANVAKYSFATESDLESSDNLAIIKKFAEIQELASELQRLIPVLQLDNKLPNNGFDTKKSLEVMADLRNDGFSFTTDNLAKRPLIKHYSKMLVKLNGFYNARFYINDNQFYDLGMQLATQIFGKNSAIYKHKETFESIKDTMYLWRAQKEFNNQIDSAPVFIQDTVNKFETIINSLNNTNESNLFISKPYGVSDQAFNQVMNQLKSAKEMSVQTPEVFTNELNRLITSENQIERIIGEAVVKNQEYAAIGNQLSNNAFIKHLTIQETKDGTKHIVPVKLINDISVSGLKVIQDAYNNLANIEGGVGLTLQKEIRAYAMLRFGMASKMGSISKMFPTGMSIAVLKNSRDFKNNAIDTQSATNFFVNPKNIEMLKANTAIMMKEKLPLAVPTDRQISSDSDLAYGTYYAHSEGVTVNTKSDFVNINNDVYRRVPESNIFQNLKGLGGMKEKGYTVLIKDKNSFDLSNREVQDNANQIKKEC